MHFTRCEDVINEEEGRECCMTSQVNQSATRMDTRVYTMSTSDKKEIQLLEKLFAFVMST